jgi:hypothetical protein
VLDFDDGYYSVTKFGNSSQKLDGLLFESEVLEAGFRPRAVLAAHFQLLQALFARDAIVPLKEVSQEGEAFHAGVHDQASEREA